MAKKRYIVTIDFYAWADNDKEVLKEVHELVSDRIEKFDDNSAIVSVVENVFASVDSKEIYNADNNENICHECNGLCETYISCCGDDVINTEYEDIGICPTCKEHLDGERTKCEECNGTGIIF